MPLEYALTAALAYTLEGSQVYQMELKGLLSGDLMLFKQATRFKDNVFLMAPYRPGRIPLVLVHGTASSPARWAEVLNEIINDQDLLRPLSDLAVHLQHRQPRALLRRDSWRRACTASSGNSTPRARMRPCARWWSSATARAAC